MSSVDRSQRAELASDGALPMNLRVLLTLALLPTAGQAAAEDWPEWRGQGRLGVWTETGILETFPKDGLEYTWRTPLRGGYAGPSVADGRVFVTDYHASDGMKGTERALALDEETGEVLWVCAWPVDYAGLAPTYAIGPRATPPVGGNRVYALGAMGALWCFDVTSGAVRWKMDHVRDYGASPGSTRHPRPSPEPFPRHPRGEVGPKSVIPSGSKRTSRA